MSSVPLQPPTAHPSKRPTVVAIREIRARLGQHRLSRLREDLFRLQLSFLEQMVEQGVDAAFVAGVANTAQAIAVVDQLKLSTRERG
jgi:hypothetical protein